MSRKVVIAGLVTVLAAFFSCNAQKQPKEEGIDRFITQRGDSLYKSGEVPGLFIGLMRNGQRQYYSFGYARPEEKTPFDSTTIFEIGSITKTFTAYVLECVLRETIRDTSKILPYLPDSVSTNSSLGPISFLSLLNHTSGLPRLPSNLDMIKNPMAPYDDYTEQHLYSYLKTCTPTSDGTSQYSNLGAGLAGALAARIAGISYEALLDKYIFGPFGIKSHPDQSLASEKHKAQGYFDQMKSNYWNANVLAPAGTLKASASEMLFYLQAMIHPPTPTAKQVVDTLLRPTINILPSMDIGRGWFRVGTREPYVYWHNGGTYGFSTFAGFIREKNTALIIVVNKFNKNDLCDELGFMILERLMR